MGREKNRYRLDQSQDFRFERPQGWRKNGQQRLISPTWAVRCESACKSLHSWSCFSCIFSGYLL